MLMFGFNKTLHQLATENILRSYGHVLRRALDFDVEFQMKKGNLKSTLKMQVQEESTMVGLSKKDALCQSR